MLLEKLADQAGIQLARVAVEFRQDAKRYVYFVKNQQAKLLNDGQSMDESDLREWLKDRESRGVYEKNI